MSSDRRVYLYDSTLRDGAQTHGVDFSAADKRAIARELDRLGIDYIEGGWPGANPTDDAFYAEAPRLSGARLTGFGMTRRPGRSAENDPGLRALLDCGAPVVTLVGKTWDFQVDVALGIELEENLAMIADSVALARRHAEEVIFDAEHFFDGYHANPDYALRCVRTAHDAGARWVVLCDTNGGMLPHDIEDIVAAVSVHVPGSHLGIHCHNDSDSAVANSLAAVRAGARQVQGTLNGLGERCGNANLVSVIPNLMLKMGYETGVSSEQLAALTDVSRALDRRLNRESDPHAPYVGATAFAHKGGLHVSAVEKDPRCYEHVAPQSVGNRRHIVVSNQAGRSNILTRFRDLGIEVDPADRKVSRFVEHVKDLEHAGLSFAQADASFELLARRYLFDDIKEYFTIEKYRVIDEKRLNAVGEWVTLSEAMLKVVVEGQEFMSVAEGNGPVHAFDAALRKVLRQAYPQLEDLELVDYRVGIIDTGHGSGSTTRVLIESTDADHPNWITVGASTNVIDASLQALTDSIYYKLWRDA